MCRALRTRRDTWQTRIKAEEAANQVAARAAANPVAVNPAAANKAAAEVDRRAEAVAQVAATDKRNPFAGITGEFHAGLAP